MNEDVLLPNRHYSLYCSAAYFSLQPFFFVIIVLKWTDIFVIEGHAAAALLTSAPPKSKQRKYLTDVSIAFYEFTQQNQMWQV